MYVYFESLNPNTQRGTQNNWILLKPVCIVTDKKMRVFRYILLFQGQKKKKIKQNTTCRMIFPPFCGVEICFLEKPGLAAQ